MAGGTVTPDTFVAHKTDLAITGRLTLNKQRMTIAVLGDINEVDVPRFLRDLALLNEEQVIETVQIAVTLRRRWVARLISTVQRPA